MAPGAMGLRVGRLGMMLAWLAIAMEGTEISSVRGSPCARQLQRPPRWENIALRGGAAGDGVQDGGQDSSAEPSDVASSEPDAGSTFQGENDKETITGLRERLKNAEEKLEEADVGFASSLCRLLLPPLATDENTSTASTAATTAATTTTTTTTTTAISSSSRIRDSSQTQKPW
jgi:hypothetical protein